MIDIQYYNIINGIPESFKDKINYINSGLFLAGIQFSFLEKNCSEVYRFGEKKGFSRFVKNLCEDNSIRWYVSFFQIDSYAYFLLSAINHGIMLKANKAEFLKIKQHLTEVLSSSKDKQESISKIKKIIYE